MAKFEVDGMGRFDGDGLDGIFSQMEKMGESTGKLAEKMLFAGAEEVKKAWKQAADKHGIRLTGQMIDSIGYSDKPKYAKDILWIDIYPQGESTYTEKNGKRYPRKKPIRNAEIAFVNHYGTSGHPGTHFVDDADDLSGPMVEKALTQIFDEWLGENGIK